MDCCLDFNLADESGYFCKARVALMSAAHPRSGQGLQKPVSVLRFAKVLPLGGQSCSVRSSKKESFLIC